MQKVLEELASISLLVLVVLVLVARLPRIDLGHSAAFRRRRVLNWLPVGLLYAFLYMGRYNLTVSKSMFAQMLDAAGQPLMDNADFGWIFGVGATVYGCAFIINGPLTDRIGGKRALLLGATGSIIANLAMGYVTSIGATSDLRTVFSWLYGANMYFQSFGAVAIVKLNAPWFHVRERGTFGAIFGILISLGVYLALDVGRLIAQAVPLAWVFFAPSAVLALLAGVIVVVARDSPAQAGFPDFDTADASSGDHGPARPPVEVVRRMLTNPVILTIAGIEFCSGFMRQSIMQWYRAFAEGVGQTDTFVYEHWGMVSCCAGILGGVFAGVISDRVFGSRRGPVTAVLYGLMVVGTGVMLMVLGGPILAPILAFMSMCVIGVHGMLSGTASMDFGGRKNAGVAVGIIDGFVYAGTAAMSFTYAAILPDEAHAGELARWVAWPMAMLPVAVVGLLLARRLWHARPSDRVHAAKAAP